MATIKDKLRSDFQRKLFDDSQAFHKKQHQSELAFEKHLSENLIEFDGYAIEIYGNTIPHNDYVARVLGIEGFEKSVTGKTREEAIANMRQAIANYKSKRAIA